MNFPFLATMLAPSSTRVAATESAQPVLQAIRAVGDYAEALRSGRPIDETALAHARCVLERGRYCDECDVSAAEPSKRSGAKKTF